MFSIVLTLTFISLCFSFAIISASADPDCTHGCRTRPGETTKKEHRKRFPVTKSDGKMYLVHGQALLHNKKDFTQGLTYSRSSDRLFQSNGLFHKSSVCHLNATSGETIFCKDMPHNYFAEGIQVYGNRNGDRPQDEKLIQITWKSKVGFIYNATTLDVIEQFNFDTVRGEGWGICYDKDRHEFIVSDGSQFLHFWDADTLEEKRRVAVTRKGLEAARNINELEFVHGKVLANVWYEDVILVIDPETGVSESEYNMETLYPQTERKRDRADVLNGISISKDEDTLYITGKMWDRMYLLSLKGF